MNGRRPPILCGQERGSRGGPVEPGGQCLTATFTGAIRGASKSCGADTPPGRVGSATAVVIILTVHPHSTDDLGPMIGTRRETTVDLAAPLADRSMLEFQQGTAVPVFL